MPIKAGGDGGASAGRDCCEEAVCGDPGYSGAQCGGHLVLQGRPRKDHCIYTLGPKGQCSRKAYRSNRSMLLRCSRRHVCMRE